MQQSRLVCCCVFGFGLRRTVQIRELILRNEIFVEIVNERHRILDFDFHNCLVRHQIEILDYAQQQIMMGNDKDTFAALHLRCDRGQPNANES